MEIRRYTPSVEDVKIAESIVKRNKDKIKSAPHYYNSGGRGIFDRYNRYFRQYIGFINDEEEKIILLNQKLVKRSDHSHPIVVLDGGNNYWTAAVNLNQLTLLEVNINAEA